MTYFVHKLRFGCFAVFFGLALTSPTLAQVPATSGQPQFRDPKTGQIWTPENVGGQSGPNTPADRAFDPRGQNTTVKGTVVQTPTVTPLGRCQSRRGRRCPLPPSTMPLSQPFPRNGGRSYST
jgi:hypothetical protein